MREYPSVASGLISVSVDLPGADVFTVESSLTTPIENALAAIDGIEYLQSSSSTGTTNISAFLKLNANADQVAIDMSNRLSAIRGRLPKEASEATLQKRDANNQPILFLTFTSSQRSLESTNDLVHRSVRPLLEFVHGMGEIKTMGERLYAMRLVLDPNKMDAYRITLADIRKALQEHQVTTTTGRVEGRTTEIEISLQAQLSNAQDFEHLILKEDHGAFVRLSDVGYASLRAASHRFSAALDGRPTLALGIVPKSNTNPLKISKDVRRLLPKIQQALPSDIRCDVFWDKAEPIRASVKNLISTIVETSVLVALVMFFFLRQWRHLIVPLVTIPLSLIAVCLALYALGYSINTLTLMAFVLAIGLVVDDAIVVVENIERHRHDHPLPIAVRKGLAEIQGPLIAMTITLAAAYAPLGFIEDITGQLFREFAFTLAGTVLFSGFIALTLSPMMCARLLRTPLFLPKQNPSTACVRSFNAALACDVRCSPFFCCSPFSAAP